MNQKYNRSRSNKMVNKSQNIEITKVFFATTVLNRTPLTSYLLTLFGELSEPSFLALLYVSRSVRLQISGSVLACATIMLASFMLRKIRSFSFSSKRIRQPSLLNHTECNLLSFTALQPSATLWFMETDEVLEHNSSINITYRLSNFLIEQLKIMLRASRRL